MATPPLRRPLSSASNSPRPRPTESVVGRPMTTNTAAGQGLLGRTPSIRNSRPIRRSPARSSVGLEDNTDEDVKNASARQIQDLREQVERSEQASEQYRHQIAVLQQRLDESTDQITVAEERDFAARTRIDQLVAEVKDYARQKREAEVNFESERSMLLREREHQSVRETSLQATVSRLTESLKTRSIERASAARSGEGPTTPARTSIEDDNLLRALQEKDAVIDTLRLELADVSFKIAESEHMGDDRLQQLETEMRDIKMQNARLMEENDSFQMLLGQKTLKGGLMLDQHTESIGANSLADELESAVEKDEVSVENYKKMEAELQNLREEKKALALYIDKILGKLMQHEGFEHIITGKDSPAQMPPPRASPRKKEKPLPLAPSAMEPLNPSAVPLPETPTTNPMSFLQRARSVVARGPAPRRPISFIAGAPTANENPVTAPSIPINRGHRRVRSDQSQIAELNAASIAQQMNKQASPSRAASGGPLDPGLPHIQPETSPLPRAQTSYFSPLQRSDNRVPSQTDSTGPTSSRNSVISGEGLESQSTDATSYQASMTTKENTGPAITAGVMKQSQLRPLRLVQEQKEADEDAIRRANRGSWMGWFNKGTTEANQ